MVTVPDRESESYLAVVRCTDSKGRKIEYETYIGYDYSTYYSYYGGSDRNYFYIDGAKEKYSVGEKVNLALKYNDKEVATGNVMFINAQNGILDYQAGKNSYEFTFDKMHMPNTYVTAYYFNGSYYESGYYLTAYINFDYSKNDLKLSAITDQETYKPGDTCSVIIAAKDENGKAKAANINVSLVDESFLALRENDTDTLNQLYRSVGNGITLSKATHEKSWQVLNMSGAKGIAGSGGGYPAPMAATESAQVNQADEGGGYVREEFKDTAIFANAVTDKNGEAVYTFKLPDNITSWRLTASGISDDLYAGDLVQNIKVTNPMFLNYTLNDEFLIGDKPSVGVSAYGTSLKNTDTVEFEVWDEKNPDQKWTAKGAAFERVDISLGEMTQEGSHALMIKATVNGMTDTVKHQYQVVKTYRQMDVAEYYDVAVNTQFAVGETGLTNITFTDKGRGQYLCALLGLRYAWGDRIEKLVARRTADQLIESYFPDIELYQYKDSFDPKKYQRPDGGMAILTYADSDVETTVKVLPYIKDDIDINGLKNYLYNIYNGESGENKMCALYGLAMLGEPVLLDLDEYMTLSDVSVRDCVYIALSYYALGETGIASKIYDERIAPKLEQIEPYYRVNTGVDNDDILSATSFASNLATVLNKSEKDGLYNYCIKNYTTDVLINLEKVYYIANEIDKKSAEKSSMIYTLFGEEKTVDLSEGKSYTLRIPAQSINAFKLTGVNGSVGAVSAYTKSADSLGVQDENIYVRRRYYKADQKDESTYEFNQGDLVRVQLWIDYSKKALDGSYCVTDYLPAGLAYVENSAKIGDSVDFGWGWRRYSRVEGQKVSFYDYNRYFDRGCLYYYYARVVSPGVFKAEGTQVQNIDAKGAYALCASDTVTIK